MVETRNGTVVIAAAALLLLLGAGTAQAQVECREANNDCKRELVTVDKVCRQDCQSEIQDTIAAAQTVCDEQALDEESCHNLIRESVAGIASECRRDCIAVRKDDRMSCRVEQRECRDAFLDPLNDECVMSCRDEFAPCLDEQRVCHDECRSGVEDAVAACHDSGLEFREKMMCIHDARQDGHACRLVCHDERACHGDIRACLSECSIDDEPEEPVVEQWRGRRGRDSRSRR